MQLAYVLRCCGVTREKTKSTLAGIVGSVMQAVFGQGAYSSIEEKAAHLLYFGAYMSDEAVHSSAHKKADVPS